MPYEVFRDRGGFYVSDVDRDETGEPESWTGPVELSGSTLAELRILIDQASDALDAGEIHELKYGEPVRALATEPDEDEPEEEEDTPEATLGDLEKLRREIYDVLDSVESSLLDRMKSGGCKCRSALS